MGKAVLHSLIDMLNEADTDTIYRVLVKFVPETEPKEDEKKSIETCRNRYCKRRCIEFQFC